MGFFTSWSSIHINNTSRSLLIILVSCPLKCHFTMRAHGSLTDNNFGCTKCMPAGDKKLLQLVTTYTFESYYGWCRASWPWRWASPCSGTAEWPPKRHTEADPLSDQRAHLHPQPSQQKLKDQLLKSLVSIHIVCTEIFLQLFHVHWIWGLTCSCRCHSSGFTGSEVPPPPKKHLHPRRATNNSLWSTVAKYTITLS